MQDLPQRIAEHLKTLTSAPNDAGTRFMLANCLYASGQRQEAEAEWERVAQSGDVEWADMVAQARETLARKPSDSVA